jgi:putative tricarboxylic transport membrane protein
MAKANAIWGVVLTLFGAYFIYESFNLPFWTDVGPGAGALPLAYGFLFVCLSAVQTVKSAKEFVSASAGEAPVFARWRIAAVVLGALFVVALLVKPLGMPIVMFLFSAFYMAVVARIRLTVAISLSAGMTLTFLVVFKWWLDVPFPMGYWQNWLTP